jgi:16S rRNA (uracil1498-N3)-methyltransferase
MRLPRFFITPEQAAGPRIVITGEDVRHIALVLRMKPGDELLACDGLGAEYRVAITAVHRSEIRTEILDRAQREIRQPHITLCQGLPKSDKMDLIVQKATELGVTAVIPLVTERTIVKLRDGSARVGRWQKIAREAAMQSCRHDIPEVHAVLPMKEFLRTLSSDPPTLLLMPWEDATLPLQAALRTHSGKKRLAVLIGPEGGFSASEATAAQERGFQAVSLGRNILRTETAAIAVLAMLGYAYGEGGAADETCEH